MRTCIGIIGVVLALAATPTHAQDDPRILFSGQGGFESFPIGTALRDLDLLGGTELVFQIEDRLLPALRDGPWDLVIIRWFGAFEGPLASDIIDELAAYVDGGGKLMFSMAELDEQPELWPVLGIERAVDVEEPLQDIRAPRDGYDNPDRRHPAFFQRPELDAVQPNEPSDFGDRLVPRLGSSVIAEYATDRTPAIILSNNSRVIVNGQEWDHWGGWGMFFAEDQIEWLLGCPADLDSDGDLTIFDFFEFQSRFDAGGDGGFADFDYNGRLDIFDFLEYMNMFDAGC